jgi:hypothetical protein
MTKRVIVAVGLAAMLAGLASMATPVQAQREVCAFPDQLKYSAGAIAQYEGQTYRCVWQFGDDLQPRSLGWVKLSPEDHRTQIR